MIELIKAGSVNLESLKQKYEMEKVAREIHNSKLDEENRITQELLNEQKELLEVIGKLEDLGKQERQTCRKLESELSREKAASRSAEDKLAAESSRREEVVKMLQTNLQYLRDHRSKLSTCIAKDKKQRDSFVEQINNLAQVYGMGTVVAPSLASILTTDSLKMARKQVLKTDED